MCSAPVINASELVSNLLRSFRYRPIDSISSMEPSLDFEASNEMVIDKLVALALLATYMGCPRKKSKFSSSRYFI